MAAIKRLNPDPMNLQGTPEFLKEITTLIQYKHENLICLLGFCCEGNEMILVYEHASHGSLDLHLNSPHLTWTQRLKICLDAAKGLEYLHDPRERRQRLIHCDVKSSNILLDDQWNAKVSDFGLSIWASANDQNSVVITFAAGTAGYCDPQYVMTNTLTKESDVYSFGVVLLEVLCGTLWYTYNNGAVGEKFLPTWIKSYKEKKLNDIIFINPTKEPLDQSALETFSDIAFQCLQEFRDDRPTMANVVTKLETAVKYQKVFWQQFEDLKIPLEDITIATNNFNTEKNYIGGGAFGKVYRGEVSYSKGRSMTAIKRLDPKHAQGITEFLKETAMLSQYTHANLASLLGFCCEEHEMILVHEHASRGSLDHHLNSSHLTWSDRLKICLDAAKGLSYLHDPRDSNRRLIHCNVKGGNILLDDHWNAKVADFGLSVMGLSNEHWNAKGYTDPQYLMTNTLTKESDIYSFGVVLFEVLCGTLCYTYSNDCAQSLVPTWIKSYEQKKLNDIIFKSPSIQPMHESALEIFSDIAYRCLKESREDRPQMNEVVIELESALQSQELTENQVFKGEWNKQIPYYEMITKTAEPPLSYKSEHEFMKLLCKGVLLNRGKTWFSLNKKGEHCEMISFADCLESRPRLSRLINKNSVAKAPSNSRFSVTYHYREGSVKTRVKTQFLSPGITYMVNLVFKFKSPDKVKKIYNIRLKYILQGETEPFISYMAYEREDGWWTCELYQFTSDQRNVDIKIRFLGRDDNYPFLEVEGIEFQPLEEVEQEVSRDEKLDMQPISNSDANWEEKLPIDYKDIIKWSENSVQWTTKKEAYLIICKGFLIDDGKKWFFLDKNGKKCHMISSAFISTGDIAASTLGLTSATRVRFLRRPSPESRFGIATKCKVRSLYIRDYIPSQLVSSQTTYACYLVYKLPEDQSLFEAPVKLEEEKFEGSYRYIYLKTPVKADQSSNNLLNRPHIKSLPQPQVRDDGWMEIQIWEFWTASTTTIIPMRLRMTSYDYKPNGLIIEGIEFRAK